MTDRTTKRIRGRRRHVIVERKDGTIQRLRVEDLSETERLLFGLVDWKDAWERLERSPTEGPWLLEWLNSPSKEKADKDRVLEIIRLLKRSAALLRESEGKPLSDVPEINSVDSQLRQSTNYYVTRPQFAIDYATRTIKPVHVWQQGTLEESQALQILETMLEHGWLGRLIQCENCEQWALKRRSDAKYCSTECGDEVYENTPERIEKKQAAARRQYKKVKSERRAKQRKERVA